MLCGEIAGRLAGQRRIAEPPALAVRPMAARTGADAARGIAPAPERRRDGQRPRRCGHRGKRRIIGGEPIARVPAQPLRDGVHLRVLAQAFRVEAELAHQIASIDPGQPRRAGAIPLAGETMAADAGILRARIAARQGKQLARSCERIGRPALGRAGGQREQEKKSAHLRSEPLAAEVVPGGKRNREDALPTGRTARLMPGLAMLICQACKPVPDDPHDMPRADPARGLAAIRESGCGACHTIPGVSWPKGKMGPALDGIADRTLIAGRVPNRPDLLARYVRNAPQLTPGTAMPAMPLSENQARDVAAYLYTLRAR